MTLIGLILYYAVRAYIIIIFVRAIFSWLNPSPLNPVYNFIKAITEPALKPVRKKLGTFRSGNMAVDISPLIVIIALYFLQRIIILVFFKGP
ncbi:MAG: hypothetical protein A2Y62_21260 [Candidatus Fischerbacteria bacterium RBG_13_37_8]|uniref:YggT family protein n=1 Tax=Candidatus Fischerbacteria bacterium RBG_13_37_8 TaxID=1817863 RepID=A0A1F5VP16_9BACT|nr:MAG: hypothetical protein A2Y62_21260 [Candidatus Fischerbacteria bacterium RBG_13_37_8]